MKTEYFNASTNASALADAVAAVYLPKIFVHKALLQIL